MGKKRIDLTSQRFGRLVVVGCNEEVSKQKKTPYWNCICDCGNEKIVSGKNLRSGHVQSCGCLQKEKMKEKWQDESFKQMQSDRLKKMWSDEEYRQMKSETSSKWLKDKWQDEEYRQMQSELQKEKMKQQWENEKFKQAKSDKMREMWQDEEFRQMKSKLAGEQMKKQWQDEEFRQIQKNIHWKGGITPISQHLRNLPVVSQWRKNAYEQVNYKCQLTGKKVHGGNSDVHHLYGLNMIVLDAHNTYNIEVKPHVKDYTEEELKLLEDYVAEWHKDSSNAVVLSEEVHILFHKEYGYGDNTPEQYEEFKKSYKK